MIDQELKQRARTPAAKGEAAPREKILKLGKKITDVVDHKLGKVRAEDAEYWGLAGVVTDEMADIALTMKLRTPYTVEELWKMNKVTEFARQRNPGMQIFPISAKTGEGVEALAAWICAQICKEKEKKETRL